MTVDMIVVSAYMGILLILAILTASRVHSLEDYAVAGRRYPAWVIYATLSATIIGGGFTIGNAEQVHKHGLIFTLAMSAIAIRELCVARFIAPHMARFSHALTIGDIMKHAYGTPAKIITGLFAGLLCAAMIGTQIRAMGYLFEWFFGISADLGTYIGFGIVLFYVSLGGFKAVVWTDVFQFIILMIALPLSAGLAVHAAGGPSALLAALPADRTDLFSHYSLLGFFSVTSYFLIGEALAPPYIQRLLAGTSKEVTRAAWWTGLTALPLGWIVSILALAALALAPQDEANHVIPFIIQTVLPAGIAGFVIAAMLAIFMSSADSFLNASAITLIHDVIKPLAGTALSMRQELWVTRALTVVIGIVSVVFALSFQNLFDSILRVYGLWAPLVLVPLVAAIRGFKGGMHVFAITALSGLSGSVVWDYYFTTDANISGMFIGTCLAGMVFLLARNLLPR